QAMCSFDLLGFQTEPDRTAFVDYLLRHADGKQVSASRIIVFGREVRTGVYPIGVHVDEARAEALLSANGRQALQLRASLNGRLLILSVDRLDYSKGLRERFLAFERFLRDEPHRHGGVIFMQIAPPSRADIQTYREIRRELEAEAGRINGRFADVDWMPLRYLNRSFPRSALMPLYAEARVGLVTPLRDGMNLVAKEFVAAQDPEDPGVLVLSQFAGAARELTAALIVNPYDEAAIAAALERGLSMAIEERRARHAALIDVLRRNSLDAWRDRFVGELSQNPPAPAWREREFR
ncbi:MAG: alpha,alpha-trehalose-phosphate synthase (UDP-forming), partial [Acetobacteraceae bacterium]